MTNGRIYGVVVSRADYRRNPAETMRLASEYGAVTIVDENGDPRTVISMPRWDDEEDW